MGADRSSGGFGARLREARERRGVSLRQIANATKISVAALEALERNDISRLPGGIFSRAFVRSYAVEVGLDPDATIKEFIAQFPSDSITGGHPPSHAVEDGVSVDNDRRMAGTFLWLVGISLPIAGALLYYGTAGRFEGASRGTGHRGACCCGAAGAKPGGGGARRSRRPCSRPDGATGPGRRTRGRQAYDRAVGAASMLGVGDRRW
jgi:transcriptional regulator with XRE-family HTH domain